MFPRAAVSPGPGSCFISFWRFFAPSQNLFLFKCARCNFHVLNQSWFFPGLCKPRSWCLHGDNCQSHGASLSTEPAQGQRVSECCMMKTCSFYMYKIYFLLKFSWCGLYSGAIWSPEFTVTKRNWSPTNTSLPRECKEMNVTALIQNMALAFAWQLFTKLYHLTANSHMVEACLQKKKGRYSRVNDHSKS